MADKIERTPLVTQEHCDCLDKCLESCGLLDELIERARAAGYNMDVQSGIVAEQRQAAKKAKAALFPDRV